MTIWIGLDEAGYGPNLGPLVVGASVWRSPDCIGMEDLPRRAAKAVRRVCENTKKNCSRLVVDDSKLLYKSGKGLAELEANTLAIAALCQGRLHGENAIDADQLRYWLDPALSVSQIHQRWRLGGASPLPRCCATRVIDLCAISKALSKAEIVPLLLAARIIYPCEFNRGLVRCGNKSSLLSEVTLRLAIDLAGRHPGESIHLFCDKHGGRDRYYALLAHILPDERIEIVVEGEAESRYRWKNSQGACEICFCPRGESHLPTAAASMTAKYVRELCMAEWNAFWIDKLPGLAPTAGYPIDARRFRNQIEPLAQKMGIDADDYWRRK